MDDETLRAERPSSHGEGPFLIAADGDLHRPRLRSEGDGSELDLSTLVQIGDQVLDGVHEADAGEGAPELLRVVESVLSHLFAAFVDHGVTGGEIDRVAALHLGSLPLLPAPAQLRELGMLGEDGLLLDHPPVLEDIGAGDVQVAVLDPLRERAVRDLLAGGVAHDGESPERALRPPQGDPPGGKRSAHQGRGKHC